MSIYFQVGEEVEVVSENAPQNNGDAVVVGVFDSVTAQEWAARKGLPGFRDIRLVDVSYELDREVFDRSGVLTLCSQQSLRKKYKGFCTFGQMMKDVRDRANNETTLDSFF